jgi:hypothetical protein
LSQILAGMAQPIAPDDDGDAQQCWGRTPDGQTFPVPITRDMMHNLFVSFPPRFTTHSRMEMLTLAVAFVMGATFLALRFIFYDGKILLNIILHIYSRT